MNSGRKLVAGLFLMFGLAVSIVAFADGPYGDPDSYPKTGDLATATIHYSGALRAGDKTSTSETYNTVYYDNYLGGKLTTPSIVFNCWHTEEEKAYIVLIHVWETDDIDNPGDADSVIASVAIFDLQQTYWTGQAVNETGNWADEPFYRNWSVFPVMINEGWHDDDDVFSIEFND